MLYYGNKCWSILRNKICVNQILLRQEDRIRNKGVNYLVEVIPSWGMLLENELSMVKVENVIQPKMTWNVSKRVEPFGLTLEASLIP